MCSSLLPFPRSQLLSGPEEASPRHSAPRLRRPPIARCTSLLYSQRKLSPSTRPKSDASPPFATSFPARPQVPSSTLRHPLLVDTRPGPRGERNRRRRVERQDRRPRSGPPQLGRADGGARRPEVVAGQIVSPLPSFRPIGGRCLVQGLTNGSNSTDTPTPSSSLRQKRPMDQPWS